MEFVFFSILKCKTTRKDSRGSGGGKSTTTYNVGASVNSSTKVEGSAVKTITILNKTKEYN